MAELGAVATILQIADVGIRLSTTLFTFAETVASADKAVSSISKDVSLTSSVLRDLANILKMDNKPQTYSNSALDSAVGVVRECSDVFQEIENILIEKLPKLSSRHKDKTSRTTAALERLRWPYLQPKINILRSNLDRLKSSLLVILNVISLAKLMRAEPSSVDAGQTALVKDLIQSNQEYVRKYEELKHSIAASAALSPFVQLNACSPREPQPQEPQANDHLEHETKPDNVQHFIALFDRLQQEVRIPSYAIGSKSRSRIAKHLSDAQSSETRHLHRIHGEAVMQDVWMQIGGLVVSSKSMTRDRMKSQDQCSGRTEIIPTFELKPFTYPSVSCTDGDRFESSLEQYTKQRQQLEYFRSVKMGRAEDMGKTQETYSAPLNNTPDLNINRSSSSDFSFSSPSADGETLGLSMETPVPMSADKSPVLKWASPIIKEHSYLSPGVPSIYSNDSPENPVRKMTKLASTKSNAKEQPGKQGMAWSWPEIEKGGLEAQDHIAPVEVTKSDSFTLENTQSCPKSSVAAEMNLPFIGYKYARFDLFRHGGPESADRNTSLGSVQRKHDNNTESRETRPMSKIITARETGSNSAALPFPSLIHAPPDTQLGSLLSARLLLNPGDISYPFGIIGPDLSSQKGVTMRKFHYNRNFLLQFSGLLQKHSSDARERWLKQLTTSKQASYDDLVGVPELARRGTLPIKRPGDEILSKDITFSRQNYSTGLSEQRKVKSVDSMRHRRQKTDINETNRRRLADIKKRQALDKQAKVMDQFQQQEQKFLENEHKDLGGDIFHAVDPAATFLHQQSPLSSHNSSIFDSYTYDSPSDRVQGSHCAFSNDSKGMGHFDADKRLDELLDVWTPLAMS